MYNVRLTSLPKHLDRELAIALATAVLLSLLLFFAVLPSATWGFADDEIFVLSYLQGHPPRLLVSHLTGRFSPLAHQEWRLLYHWTTDVRLFYFFAALQFLLFSTGIALLLYRRASQITILMLFVATQPPALIAFSNLVTPERSVVMLFPWWLIAYLSYQRTGRITFLLLCSFLATAMIFYKEPTALFMAIFSTAAILLRSSPKAHSSFRPLRADILLLLISSLYFVTYALLIHISILRSSSLYNGHSFAANNILPTLAAWGQKDAISVLIIVAAVVITLLTYVRQTLPVQLALGSLSYFFVLLPFKLVSTYYLALPTVAAALAAALTVANLRSSKRMRIALAVIVVTNLIWAMPYFFYRYDWLTRNREIVDQISRLSSSEDKAAVYVSEGAPWDIKMLALYANKVRGIDTRFDAPISGFGCFNFGNCGYRREPDGELRLNLGKLASERTAQLFRGNRLIWRYRNRYATSVRVNLPHLLDDVLIERYNFAFSE